MKKRLIIIAATLMTLMVYVSPVLACWPKAWKVN